MTGQETTTHRFSVEFVVANNRDVVVLPAGVPALESVKHSTLSGVVDSGAARLVLPQWVVEQLHLQIDGETTVRHADRRRERRTMVGNVWLQLLGRHGVFSAVIE